jgi:hypothetical protein
MREKFPIRALKIFTHHASIFMNVTLRGRTQHFRTVSFERA